MGGSYDAVCSQYVRDTTKCDASIKEVSTQRMSQSPTQVSEYKSQLVKHKSFLIIEKSIVPPTPS